jgi:hypothetical protein
MKTVFLSKDEVEKHLSTERRTAAIGTTGSGVWSLHDVHPRSVLLLEAEDLPHWTGDLLVFYYGYQSPELLDWLDRHCPDFDRAVLGELEPRAGVLFTRS